MKNNKNLKLIFTSFIAIMIGVSFLIGIANTVDQQITTQDAADVITIAPAVIAGDSINASKEFTVSHYPNGTNTANLPLENFVITNGTGVAATITTDYLINTSTGVFTLKNSTYWRATYINDNQTNVTYDYYSSNYIENDGARTFQALTVFLAALGLLLAVIAYLNWDYIRDWFGK